MNSLTRYIQPDRESRQSARSARMAAMAQSVGAAHKPSISMGGTTSGPVPKGPQPVRDENYRRLVATLPCYACRIVGYSNAAHPNSGKAKGVKLSDDECFPLCVDRPGIKGCHPKFDQYEIVNAEGMPAYERDALAWTRDQLALAPIGEMG